MFWCIRRLLFAFVDVFIEELVETIVFLFLDHIAAGSVHLKPIVVLIVILFSILLAALVAGEDLAFLESLALEGLDDSTTEDYPVAYVCLR